MILAGDVGATKILLEVGEVRSSRWEPLLAKRYATAEIESFSTLLGDFLGEWNRAKAKTQRITAAGFGVAGPAQGNKVKMTHRPWAVDGDKIASQCLIPKVCVVNDLAAAAHGIAWLGPRDCVPIQAGKVTSTEPLVVMGVGTGLGVAYLIPTESGYRAVPGEGGHAGFAPANLRQAQLWHSILASHGRVAAEDVVSGIGLAHVFAFVRGQGAHQPGRPEDTVSPEWITRTALDKSDPDSHAALELFVECLANVAGDHALTVVARGGVYLVGGVITRILPSLQEGRFCEFFCAKGPHSAMMMKIPVRAVRNERIVVLGAARLASEL